MPTKVIELGLHHSKNNSDFDRQVAFLLLDIGVESALKVFLMNKKDDDIEYIKFPDLLKRIKDNLDKMDVQEVDLDQVKYFHGLRNKLYHQGDGVTPTKENLEKYGELAKVLLKVLLDIDITKIAPDSDGRILVQWNGREFNRTVEDINTELLERLEYFQESCATLSEQLLPKFTTRKFALELKNIWTKNQYGGGKENWGDSINGSEAEAAEMRMGIAKERLRLSEERLRLFCEVTEKSFEDYEFADLVLENVNHLFVMIVLQKLSENVEDDWEKYKNVFGRISESKLVYLDSQRIIQEYQTIRSWIDYFQDKVDKRLIELLPNIYRPGPNLSALPLTLLWDWE